MSWREVLIILYGIEKQKIEAKRNARDVAYAIHIHNVEKRYRYSVFDFMPLPGDPTKAEINAAKKVSDDREAKQLRQIYDEAIKMFNQN